MDSKIINSKNALWKDLMLYWWNINLILNSNQVLALFRQKQILRYNRHKNLQKQNNEDFFIQLLNAWLHFTNNKFPAPMSIEEILHQPIHLSTYTKLDFSSNKPCFIVSDPKIFQTTIIRNLCRFLQPGLISSMTFEEKLGLSNINHKIICKLILCLTCNNWKQILRPETPPKLFWNLCYKNKGTRKIKEFPKLSNKEIYFTLQSINIW